MKKNLIFILSFLFLGILLYPSSSSANTSLSIPHRFSAYDHPDFSSEEVATFASTTVTVLDQQGDYWYLVETENYGDKWVYYDPNLPETKTFNYTFNGYTAPDFTSPRASSFQPATVDVLAKHNNWFQVDTANNGHVWVYDGSISIEHRFTAYENPGFSSNKVTNFQPATVKVVSKNSEHWYEVATSNYGNVWVYYNSSLGDLTLDYKVNSYESPSFSSTFISSFSPQVVDVVAKDGNWYQIETTNYDLVWLYYQKLTIPHRFSVYDSASFNSKISEYASQTVEVVKKSGGFWYLINTDTYGRTWIYYNPNLGNLTIPYRFNGYEEPNTSSNKVSSFSSQTVKVTAKTGNWYEFATASFGNLWVYYDGNAPEELIVPLKGTYVVTSRYGSRGTSFHYGIDLDKYDSDLVNGTTNIIASGSGEVTRANWSSSFGYVVYIYHSNMNLTTVYAHMRENLQVSVGQQVSQGQTIGYMGNTGNSFGQHLHFEVHDGQFTYKDGLNPENYIDF